MKKYINVKDGTIVIVSNINAAGMCEKTIGLTFVIYKSENSTLDYPFVMENCEFHKKYKITH